MVRMVKTADERRNEILDAASEFFAQKGFDDTSVNDILERVGIAKGTFYYHFKSKEDMLDALIERHGARMLASAEAVSQNVSLSVHEKIFYAMDALNMREADGGELLTQMHKPQNALMHEKSLKTLINGVTPILTSIVREGVAQGLFDTVYPKACVEMIITYVQIAFDDEIVPSSDDEKAAKIPAFTENIERLLGAEKGSFAYILKLFNGENYD